MTHPNECRARFLYSAKSSKMRYCPGDLRYHLPWARSCLSWRETGSIFAVAMGVKSSTTLCTTHWSRSISPVTRNHARS